MKRLYQGIGFKACVSYLALGVALVLLSTCGGSGGGGDGGGNDGSWETGSVSFRLELESLGSSSADQEIIAAQIDCEEAGIDRIMGRIFDEGDSLLVGGGPWKCEEHEATLEGVLAGENRIVVVDAKDGSGDTTYRGISEPFTVLPDQANDAGIIELRPFVPSNVVASPGDGEVTIRWDSVADATSYNLYWSTSPGVSKDGYEGLIPDVIDTSYLHKNRTTGGKTYSYVVTAEDRYGEGGESEEVAATPYCGGCDLNRDGWCDEMDEEIFFEDWGRIDCHDPGVACECDLNEDGRCDMQDWEIFGEDWERCS
jgi:hypothetical protein